MVTIPYDLVDQLIDWPFGNVGCKYLVMPIMEHFAAVCVLTHTAVAVARYVIIRSVGTVYKIVSTKNVRFAICIIWLVSFLVLSTTLMGLLGEFRLGHRNGKLVCTLMWISKRRQRIYRICVFILTYVIPTIMTGFSYYQIHKVVTRNMQSVDGHLPPDVLTSRRKKSHRMNKTFMTMFILITLTTFPLQLFMFLYDFNFLPMYQRIRITFDIFLILFYTQVIINPFVLFYMGQEYRKEICGCFFPLQRQESTHTITCTLQSTNSVNIELTEYRFKTI